MVNATTPATIDKIRRAWLRGDRRDRIAAETGVHPQTVTKYCRDLPRPVEHRGRPRKDDTDNGT